MVADHQDENLERDLKLAEQFQRAYAEALLAGDQRAAERVIREAIEAGLSEALIGDEVIRPALVLVGDLWADGRITIADEHLATSISVRVLALQREAFRVARERAAHRVMLAGVQCELHVVGLDLAASVILHAGYDVRVIGADLPVSDVAAAVTRHRPSVVGFTTATSLSAVNLPASIEAVRRASSDTGIVVGGRAAEPRMAAGAGVVVCRHVTDAVAQVDGLVKQAGRN